MQILKGKGVFWHSPSYLLWIWCWRKDTELNEPLIWLSAGVLICLLNLLIKLYLILESKEWGRYDLPRHLFSASLLVAAFLCSCGMEYATHSHKKNKWDLIFFMMIVQNICNITHFTTASFDAFYSLLVQNPHLAKKSVLCNYVYIYIYISMYV